MTITRQEWWALQLAIVAAFPPGATRRGDDRENRKALRDTVSRAFKISETTAPAGAEGSS